MGPISVRQPKEQSSLVKLCRYIPPICIFIDHPYITLEREYLRELEKRGNVPKELWIRFEYSQMVKERFDRILKFRLWSPRVDFHPDDPYWIIGGLQTGDLSEAEVIMDLEDELKIKIPEETVEEWSKMSYSKVLEMLSIQCSA